MKPGYEPTSLIGAAGWVIEEYGETLQCLGKCMRLGLDGSNPDLPEPERETNQDALEREMMDVVNALSWGVVLVVAKLRLLVPERPEPRDG